MAMNRRVVFKGNLIKETNYKKILHLICSGEQLTKLDIAYALKISIPTVAANLNELKEKGIIEEAESDIYTGGRKPKIVRLIADSRISIGISITKFRVNAAFMNLKKEAILTKEAECEPGELIKYISCAKRLINEGKKELKLEDERIIGIGIAIPGSIDQNKGIIEQTNIGTSAVSLEKIYNLFDRSIYIENEANLSLLAEKYYGNHQNLRNLLYIGINEGLGGGILVNDEIFTGTSGRAGEFGRMRFIERATGKGYRVEEQASTKGMIQHYKQQTGKNIKSFANFEKLVKEGNQAAVDILVNGIEMILMTVYNLTMVLDIQNVIIGGKAARLIKSQPELLRPLLEKYKEMLETLNLDICFSDIKHAAVIGAALLPILDFYKINVESE